MLLELILLVALHGEQGIDLAFQAADGKEQFFGVGGVHGVTQKFAPLTVEYTKRFDAYEPTDISAPPVG